MRRRHFLGSAAFVAQALLTSSVAYAAGTTPGRRLLDSDENYVSGSYGAYASSWGAALEPRPLLKGRDFINTIAVDIARFPAGSNISWRWPDHPPERSGVYGYLHIYRGNYDGGMPPLLVEPVMVRDLAFFSQDIAFTHHGGPTDGYNVLNEFWLTQKDGDHTRKAYEIGFMLHTNRRTSETIALAEPLGMYSDHVLRRWRVVRLPGAIPYIIFVPEDQKDFRGTLEVRHALQYLVAKAVITGGEWINGVAIGVEPHFGGGALTLDHWKAEFG